MGRLSDLYTELSQQQAEAESQYIRTTTPGLRMPSPEPEPMAPEEEEQPGLLSDAWSSFGIGAGQLVKGAEWLFGTDTNVGQTTMDYWQGQLSDAQVEANEQRFVDEDMTLGEGFSNPRTWMGTIVQSLPMMVPGISAAGGVAKFGIKAGMSKAGATAAGAAAGSGVEGATIGALVGEEVEQVILNAPIEELRNSPYFQDLVDAGKSEDEARRMVAEKTSDEAALKSGIPGALLGIAFNKFVGDAVTGRLSERLLKETGKGVAEGAGTEAAQTGVESYAKQTALNENLGRPYDLPEAANEIVGGTGAGGVMGGAVGFGGGLAGSNTPEQPAATGEEPPAPQPAVDPEAEQAVQPEQPTGPDEPAFDDGLDNIGQRMTEAENQPISIRNRGRNLATAPEAPAPLSEQVGTDVNAEGPQIVYQQDGITVEQEDNQFRAYNEGGLEAFGTDAADARRKLNRQIERNWPKGPILQNRDRNTPAYIAQMREIAQNPKYNRVSTSREPTTGAPMAFPRGIAPEIPAMNLGRKDTVTMSDGKGGEREVPVQYAVVEADDVQASHRADGKENKGYTADGLIALNNGRTAGLQAAYEQGNADPYLEAMLADDMHGIDPAAIRSKQRPMLVRLFDGQSLEGIDNPGDASNTSPMADLSLSEQAKTDAGKLDNAILSEIEPGDPTGSGNSDFVTRAVNAIGKGDTDTVMRDREGLLTSAGQRRIRGALIARAYSDDTLTQELVEATDSDLKTLGDALTEVAGRWALMREQARDNAINPDMDVTDALVSAVNMIRKSRQEGRSLKDIAGQIDAFAGEADQMAVYMLSLFYRGASFNRIRSKDAIAGALSNYIETALQSSPGVDMFGEQTQPQEVLSREAEQAEGSTGEQAQEAAPRVRTDGPDNRDAGPEGEGSGRETGREEDAGSGEQVTAAGETENLTPDLAVETETANEQAEAEQADNLPAGDGDQARTDTETDNEPDAETARNDEPEGTEVEAGAAPAFETYADAQQWIDDRAQALGMSRKEFTATDEYKAAYPQIDALFQVEKAKNNKARWKQAEDAGIQDGNKVETFVNGERVTGTIYKRPQGPGVRIDGTLTVSKNGKLREAKTIAWDSRWTKVEGQTAEKPAPKKPEPKAESKPEPKRENTVTAQGVTVRIPTIDQQLIDDFNRNTYIAGKRDLNQELRDTAESVLNSLADKPNTLVTDEQKAKAKELVEAYIEKEAEFARWDASYNARNPSWIVTGRSNRNMEKANRKNEKHMDEYSRRVAKTEAQRKRIESTLYEMRPDSVKADQAVKADQRRITQLVADIAMYMGDGRQAMEKETRKWASPKAHKAMEKALERDRAATIGYLQEIEASETVVNLGGLAKILGPRSKAGKLVTELLGDSVESRRSSYRPNPGQNDLFADADALQQLELDDAYDNLETRPNTTQAQRRAGRSALRDFFRQLNARLERQGQLPADGSGVSLLGAAIYKNFKEGKPNQLIGQTVRTPRDLAALAQVYRDPRFETFRFILTRNGEVVSEQAITSRLPAAVSFQNIDATIADLKQSMADFEADGYYMLHNHPSGKSSPSAADFAFTDKISEEVPGYIQHVVIDTNEYSVIGRKDEGFETIQDDTLGSTDFWGNPESPHDVLGTKITGPDTLGKIAKTLQQPDRAVFVGTTARGEVALVTSFPGKTVRSMMNRTASKKRQVEAAAIIRRLRRASGSGGYGFLVVSNESEARALKNLMSSGAVRDIVTPDGFSLASVELRAFSQDLMDSLPKKTMRVADKQTGYRRTPETRTDALTAPQARTYANTLMRDWKDRPGVTVADSISEFPKPLREAIRQAGAESDMRAVFWNQEVFILAPRIPNTQALEEVILHEVVGHYGLRKMVGKELIPLLNRVYMDMSKTEQAAEIKRNYFPGNTFDSGNREHRLVVAEELLAHLAESGKQRHRTLWQRIVAAIRDRLRRLGFTVSMNENDLLKILEGAQRTVEQGGFSRPSEADTYFRRAYHGTPHRFDKFSLEAIGTGEGAQAYGYGLYFAEKREIAEYYKDVLSNDRMDDAAPDDVAEAFFDELSKDSATGDTVTVGDNQTRMTRADFIEAWMDEDIGPFDFSPAVRTAVEQKFSGNLYEVEIPEDSKLLDWGRRLDDQPAGITEAVRAVTDEYHGEGTFDSWLEANEEGGDYREWADNLMEDMSPQEISQALNERGVPGLRYLDAVSRIPGEDGTTYNYVIWDDSLVSVQAINDQMAQAEAYFSRTGTEQPMFSRAGNRLDAAATHFSDLTDDQRAALGKIAPRTPKERAQDWLKERTDRWQTKVRQGAVDRFAALADVDVAVHGRDVIESSTASSSWVLAQMSGSAAGALQSMLTTARIKLNGREKVITTQDGTQGLNDTLKQLGSAAEIERFFGWIAGNRSRRLMAEGRENLFEPQEVEALAQLNRGTTDSGQSRLTLYDNVFREFQQYRDDVLAIAEQSGIITPEQRETWANEFYVPFYRLAEDDGSFTGPKATGGISRQEAYKKLKGGSRPLNDLLENTMMNFHHLLQASLKNQAAMQAMDNSQEMGIAREVREADRDTENSTFILRDGQKIWYEIDDPLVFKAVTALAHPGMNSTAMKMMRGFKRLFTNLTTTTPQFVIANLLRDSMQAAATSEVSKNILKNMAQGSKVYGDPKIRAKMLASGGSFSFGHLYGENADELRLRITGGLAQADILRSPSMIPNAISGMWRKWNEMTEFTENINRAAIFEQNQDRGELYAAFKARDLMNFSQHGAWPAMRVLIDVVPFLNARLQGLDKIYRSGVKPGLRTAMGQGTASEKQAAMRFWSVTGTLALASIALYLNNRDDEEYKKLEEWQKDTYWYFRVSDDHAIFIPKPFEVGAIATMAERLTEQAVSDTATGKLFASRLSHMLLDTFSFSPVPQMFQPALDIYSNYDAFTGRPIESMGMERLSPSLRRRNNTTALATGLSAATESVFGSDGRMTLSPVQIDHAIQGYFGSVGSWVAGIADTVWRTANGETAPSTFWYENQPVRRFYKNLGDEDRYTRYGTVFYEALKETNRVYADIKEYAELGEVEKARSLYQENRNKLAYRVILNRVQRKLSEINSAMQKVRRLEASPEYKRRELDRLRAMKNRIQEAVGGNLERLNASDS